MRQVGWGGQRHSLSLRHVFRQPVRPFEPGRAAYRTPELRDERRQPRPGLDDRASEGIMGQAEPTTPHKIGTQAPFDGCQAGKTARF